MKKAKNETAVKKNAKIAQSTKLAPAEKIRAQGSDDRSVEFKKVLYGYDPDEVAAYIAELRETYESAARIQDLKMASMKEELALSNRERDSNARRYRELQESVSAAGQGAAQPAVDRTAELEAVIAQYKERVERLEAENERLRTAAEQDSDKRTEEYVGRIAALEKENSQLGVSMDFMRRENEELGAVSQKYEALSAEYKNLTAQVELLKAELASKDAQAQLISDELERRIAEINEMLARTQAERNRLAELEVESGVLRQRLEESEAETARLREANKAQAHDCAERISALESEQANGRLAIQKEIKLREYYIGQAEQLIEELAKQVQQIKGIDKAE